MGGGSLSVKFGGQTLFNVSQCSAHELPVPYFISRPISLDTRPPPPPLRLWLNILDLHTISMF